MKKLLSALIIICALFVTAYAQDAKIPVLLYHNIAYEYNPQDELINISPDRFAEHLQALKDDGYDAISYMDYYNYAMGRKELPARPVIIAFDDGYINNYEFAYPILKEKAMKAIIFIVTESVGKTPGVVPHFTWEQAREMESSGVIDIESHTHTHRDLTSMSEGEFQRELRVSKYLIEKNMNKKCLVIAYPYGFTNETIIKDAKSAGYLMQNKVGNVGYNTKENISEPLNRLTISGSLTGWELIEQINSNL